MSRVAVGFFLAIALIGCEVGEERARIEEPVTITCPAAEILIQAPESAAEIVVDFDADAASVRMQIAELLGNDTCQNQMLGICFQENIQLGRGGSVSAFRSRVGFGCDWQSTYHTERIQILINRSGQILCEGNLVPVAGIRECYRKVFMAAIADDFPFVAADLDWDGAHGSLIGRIISELALEHWAIIEELAMEKRGVSACELMEDDCRELAGPFTVILSRRLVAPPIAPVRIYAPTILIEVYDSLSDTLR